MLVTQEEEEIEYLDEADLAMSEDMDDIEDMDGPGSADEGEQGTDEEAGPSGTDEGAWWCIHECNAANWV